MVGAQGASLGGGRASNAMPLQAWQPRMPEGWLQCPPYGSPIGPFIPMKVRSSTPGTAAGVVAAEAEDMRAPNAQAVAAPA